MQAIGRAVSERMHVSGYAYTVEVANLCDIATNNMIWAIVERHMTNLHGSLPPCNLQCHECIHWQAEYVIRASKKVR